MARPVIRLPRSRVTRAPRMSAVGLREGFPSPTRATPPPRTTEPVPRTAGHTAFGVFKRRHRPPRRRDTMERPMRHARIMLTALTLLVTTLSATGCAGTPDRPDGHPRPFPDYPPGAAGRSVLPLRRQENRREKPAGQSPGLYRLHYQSQTLPARGLGRCPHPQRQGRGRLAGPAQTGLGPWRRHPHRGPARRIQGAGRHARTPCPSHRHLLWRRSVRGQTVGLAHPDHHLAVTVRA